MVVVSSNSYHAVAIGATSAAAAAAAFGLVLVFFRPSYERQMEQDVEKEAEYRYTDTLVSLLKSDQIPLPELYRRGYGPVLEIVRVLIGVVPKCDEYLEIWPPAFRTYNLMVPNWFDIPFSTLQITRVYKETALAMYVASRTAECPYCSAHTCSFAIRRGVQADAVKSALLADDQSHLSEVQRQVVALARGLAQVPTTRDSMAEIAAAKEFLYKHFGNKSDVESIALGAVGMGFLNKVMDSLGVELETSTYLETKANMGNDFQPGKAGHDLEAEAAKTAAAVAGTSSGSDLSNDGVWARLVHLRYIPGAVALEMRYAQKLGGVPNKAPAARARLRRDTGHDFPVLGRLRNSRAVFSLTAMLLENLSETGDNDLPCATKQCLGLCFAVAIDDGPLKDALWKLSHADEMSKLKACNFAKSSPLPVLGKDHAVKKGVLDDTEKGHLLLSLTKAISPSPAQVTTELVEDLAASNTTPAEIVEVVSLVATLQLLHRLMAFYPPPYDTS